MAQCAATIYVRDTYRRTGRGRSGFEMHYTRQQCSRATPEGERYCWQHRGHPDFPRAKVNELREGE